jgi:hypothetical protein
MSSLLYQTSAEDPMTLSAVAFVAVSLCKLRAGPPGYGHQPQ